MLKKGIYQHYKGHYYRLIGVAKHSETLEPMVVYGSMQTDQESQLWVRPLEMFKETVEVDGKTVARFQWVREE